MAKPRSLVPIAAVCAAALLLALAAKQQDDHQGEFQRRFPQSSHLDYAYNPPARLLALVIAGPGVLVPTGFRASGSFQAVQFITSLGAVLLFWYSLLYLLRKNRNEVGVKKAGTHFALHASFAAIAMLGAYHAGNSLVRDVASLNSGALFWHVMESYGFATVLWVKCVTALWMLALTTLMAHAAMANVRSARASSSP